MQVSAGQIGQPPSVAGQSYQISVRAVGRLIEPSEFENIILKSGTDGTLVRLRDVGRAELGAEDYGSDLRFNGHDAVGFGRDPAPRSQRADRRQSARKPNCCGSPSTSLRASNTPWRSTLPPWWANRSKTCCTRLLEAIGLVVLVIFIFLQDWRSTFIPAITIPVSLIGTFAFVKIFGFSINTLTLFGLTLATGLVVDDAIVVIENVQRHITEGISEPHNAASVAMREVAGAVIATSLVLVAVFVPVAFFPGTTGILFRQFALTIAFSVSISAFNALTLTPALSAIFLGHEHIIRRRFFRAFNTALASFDYRLRKLLRFILRLDTSRPAFLLAFSASPTWCTNTYRTVSSPTKTTAIMFITVQAPPGASLEYTDGDLLAGGDRSWPRCRK